MSELKPCLCGSEVRWCGEHNADPDDNHECHQIHCDNCGIQFDVDNFETKDAESITELSIIIAKAWNTRTPQSEWISVESYRDIPVGTWQVATEARGSRGAETHIATVAKNVTIIGNCFAFDLPRVYAYAPALPVPPKQ